MPAAVYMERSAIVQDGKQPINTLKTMLSSNKDQQVAPGVFVSPQHPSMFLGRRLFLRYAGFTVAASGLLMACSSTETVQVTPTIVDLGSGDTGILNYAYALEQLEAAFYTKVIASPYANMTADEKNILTEIRDHEIIHREFFKAALGSAAIIGLTPNFAAINFGDRASVLGAAKTFEDLGVGAYNGAGKLIKSADYLTLAGKIVSVEARHAAVIRDLLAPRTAAFAGDDVINPSGLDNAYTPSQVLPLAQPFVTNKISGANLPQ